MDHVWGVYTYLFAYVSEVPWENEDKFVDGSPFEESDVSFGVVALSLVDDDLLFLNFGEILEQGIAFECPLDHVDVHDYLYFIAKHALNCVST